VLLSKPNKNKRNGLWGYQHSVPHRSVTTLARQQWRSQPPALTSDVSTSVTISALDVRSDQHVHADHLSLDMRRQKQNKTTSIKSTAVASSRERGEEEYVCYGEKEDLILCAIDRCWYAGGKRK
jgi:hypothetical protein